MAIKKSADGYYHTSVRYNGQSHSVAGKTEAEAHRKAGALMAELKRGGRAKTSAATVEDFCRQWLQTYHGTETENDKRYEQLVRLIIVPAIGRRKLSGITELDLQQLLNDNAEYSKSHLEKLRMTLKQIFKRARKNHLITDDPAEDLTLPPCKAGTHREITAEERERILRAAESSADGLYIKIILFCGLRPNEVDALQWSHVDTDKRVIKVRQAVKHGTADIGPPKSAAGVRDVPIPEALYYDLLESKPADLSAFVCLNKAGERHTAASRNRMWNSFKRDMDIAGGAVVYRNRIMQSTVADDLTLYCLRHTYCTDLQRAGVPLNVAKVLMGHEDISVTANIYTHVSEADTQAAVRKLDEFIQGRDDEEQLPSNVLRFPRRA